ncbi:hypothetical protein SAMN05421690_1003107 [Nitrosomonas sp. Nm51]|uniref:hypothetical protein n=1 Tax=Nitrosomonas sp. Nm51 TaxID=133720 RepID=UPI0008C87D90|nr:hypothetical protein [Nitrosomonas sp. Nm51]SEQ91210.1 hypothetical protein SAMN05421690_1003107 [Nitrosomonas sp. Nm51]
MPRSLYIKESFINNCNTWAHLAGCNASRKDESWHSHGDDEQRRSVPARCAQVSHLFIRGS